MTRHGPAPLRTLIRGFGVALALLVMALPALAKNLDAGALRRCVSDAMIRADEARRAGDQPALALSLAAASGCHAELAELDAALETARAALLAAEDAGDPVALISAHLAAGDAYYGMVDYERALEHFRMSQRIAERSDEGLLAARASKNSGILLKYLGRYEEALLELASAAKALRELGDVESEISALASLGGAWFFLGEYEHAEEAYRVALELAQASDDRSGIQHLELRLGLLRLEVDEPEAAIVHLERSRELADELGRPVSQNWVRALLASALAEIGREAEAIASIEESVAMARRIGNDQLHAEALLELASFSIDVDPERALELVSHARRLHAGIGTTARVRMHVYAGRAYAAAGDAARGIDELEAAVLLIEARRARVDSERFRVSFIDRHDAIYRRLTALHLQHAGWQGTGVERAFELTERSRAQELLARLDAATGERLPSPPGITQARALLDPRTALISYYFLPQGLAAFVVTQEGVSALRLPLDRATAGDRIDAFLELLGAGRSLAWQPIARRLHEELLALPLLRLAPEVERVIIVPDAELHALPFEALSGADGRFLVERLAVSYAPSVSVLAHLEGRTGDEEGDAADLLVLGDPARDWTVTGEESGTRIARLADEGVLLGPLHHAGREARAVHRRGSSDSVILLREEATEEALRAQELPRFDVLHFATHGLASRRRPARSGLLLTPAEPSSDGLLEIAEIHRLRLDADLVVLSACRSAGGRIHAGEGVFGMTRAFLHAGARAVVASLWDVGDEDSERFMRRFYDHLAKGASPAVALRRTKLDLLREADARSPEHWSFFVLVGTGEEAIPLESRAGYGTATAVLVVVVLALWGASRLWRRKRSAA